jgi:protein-L-isoaspartate O-methyltransferase
VVAAMHNQDWLVDHLRRDGVVKHHAVEQALRQCDRKNYVDADIPHAYIYQV